MKAKPLVIAVSALLATACTPPSGQPPNSAHGEAPTPAPGVPGIPINADGTVTQVDATAGTVSIDHGPILALGWPAMTMQFHVEAPASLQGIAVGDHVAFQLKSGAEPSIITSIQKQ